ncbi:MAG: 1-deoxy-D-xylulose-5-phosphate reductoisomerase [Ruminococcaceae bacterium]|nr:1-deoxy-D-xylulose-5-phosphate reductoisomerase [Oscillospiraceae bacterium]
MNDKKHITVLGSTGSIGTQALRVTEFADYAVDAIAFGSNIKLGEEQIRKFKPKFVSVNDENAAADLKMRVSDTDTKILSGKNCVCEMLEFLDSDVCINAISGFDGLLPTLTAIERFPRLGLANKETIVAAGTLVKQSATKNNCEIIPVDSEHSAIFQCLEGNKNKTVRRILLTCSGGPFFGKKMEDLKNVTVSDALGHPTWKMGAKITIDSATLMNKGLELIEAMHLFDVSPEQIEVLIHRESIIHSMVEYNDKAVIAQLGVSDMCLPIQYAITYPNRMESPCEALDFFKIGKLTFFEPDRENFPLLALAEKTAQAGGLLPCVMNAANEEAVSLFLDGKISFTDIFDLVYETVENYRNPSEFELSDIIKANFATRELVKNKII